jgi:hypothetical protein
MVVAHTDKIMGELDFLLHPFILFSANLNDIRLG